ncbi:diguanylate cyclase (GGDEF) domain-containing protein [Nitrosomonas cryotolerans]|uniref:diguanylate cyclase n=1 Tax=Nitrosomonas cryotolerans ATCC 49181 TaxID=1131553 RepID=A0A1N6J031_9PROT|nr:GGDEF domain-containing protein [Nitrosomonas cryotolerans]SFP54237.1 diguanylate cyclase (GGDEF) domain-containing protein [Nitrosomonas cryotolerans]SIO37694.1 diguanylate cyclase [Nitrosomonas cryotolerans ATCC 49181]
MNDILTRRLRFCTTLPSLPTIAIKILEIASNPDADITQICHYISLDPALATKILRVANSPLFKSRRVSNNIRQAVGTLGTHAVIVIALSFSLTSSLMAHSKEKENIYPFDNNNFWRRSIVSALASRILGEKFKLKGWDDLFLAGLLQDIGILALSALMPEEYSPVFSSACDHGTLLKSERKAFGTGHDEIGYLLLKQWHIPDHISIACLASHHQPAPDAMAPTSFDCIAASGYIADYFLDPKKAGNVATVTNAVQRWLGIDSMELKEIIDTMETEIHSVAELFEVTIHHPTEIADIIAQAKELLTIHSLTTVRELEDKTQRDGLTGAHNRLFFDNTLQKEFHLSQENAFPLTIAMIDIDYFKKVNDTHGHVAGDILLVAIVRKILGQIRQDDVLSRYGGEEFSLILPGTTLAISMKLLTRLKDNIAAISYKLDNGTCINITVSIGVAVNMDNGIRFACHEDMLKAADLALYSAKHAGRNRIVEWNPSLKN